MKDRIYISIVDEQTGEVDSLPFWKFHKKRAEENSPALGLK